jgi:serine/threonine-protein kinase
MMTGELVAGRYRLAAEIGQGDTGTVFRAVAEPGGEAVAVKILRAGAGGRAAAGEASRRFEREALAVGKLQHPNLVAIRDFGALDDGRPFLIMDLVEGRGLAEVLAEEGRLPEARALGILVHVLRGLGHAHASGVVHRDLKPADILLTERGGERDVAVIVDFGTAALLEAGAQPLTRAGLALGAPAYMAPERLDPDATASGRADLYSATCILFEMLAGQPPHGAAGQVAPEELLARHARGAAPRLSDATPPVDASAALEAIVARGLARSPAARFADAAEYLAAIEAHREGRLDPAQVAAPRARPPGALAEPDPHKATTVFHGAPAPAPPPAAPAEAAAAGQAATRRRNVVVGAVTLAALVAAVIVIARVRSGRPAIQGDPMAGLVDAWRAAGLEPGPFIPEDSDRWGGGLCRKGAVGQVDVVVCLHATPADALAARKPGMRAMRGSNARSVAPSGRRVLFASTRQTAEPNRLVARVTEPFQLLPPFGQEKRGRRSAR